MSERAVVLETRGDTAIIELAWSGDCERCGACSRLGDSDRMVAEVENRVGAVTGDRLMIDLEPGAPIQAALIAYLVPLVAFVAGNGATYLAFFIAGSYASRLEGLIGGMVFAVMSLRVSRRVNVITRSHRRFRLRVVEPG